MDFYHIINRGVDKRSIVKNDTDRVRFVHDLYAFNDRARVGDTRMLARRDADPTYVRDLLVQIHAWVLMDNHYHLLLSPRVEDGISKYMQKLNMGYAKFFNEKYIRTGALFQGKYKKLLIERDAHFMYIPHYIHLNPLDYSHPEWRTGKLTDIQAAQTYLSEYRWSSYLDYLTISNFPSIIAGNAVEKIYESEVRGGYATSLLRMLKDRAATQESECIE